MNFLLKSQEQNVTATISEVLTYQQKTREVAYENRTGKELE